MGWVGSSVAAVAAVETGGWFDMPLRCLSNPLSRARRRAGARVSSGKNHGGGKEARSRERKADSHLRYYW